MKRVFLIVLDSVGIGPLPDHREFDPEPGNTLGHIAEAMGGIFLPQLGKMGLGNILPLRGVPPVENPLAAYGRGMTKSPGKDTTTGHWEMMGIVQDVPFPTYPQGFPGDLVRRLETAFQRKIIGNKAASGVKIIEELGEEHMRTGSPIVYTSADSVLQIAAHEEVIPLEALYELCTKAREICAPPHHVGRVIARPFNGLPGHFVRTAYRRDFSLLPPEANYLNYLREAKVPTVGVGKIGDIFARQGLDIIQADKGNQACTDRLCGFIREGGPGFYFINLVDFDMLYGHRNDPLGYGAALETFDAALSGIFSLFREDDLLIITADHGNDPTTSSSDHNREYVPILAYRKMSNGKNLGTRASLADIGATCYEALTGARRSPGDSFYNAW